MWGVLLHSNLWVQVPNSCIPQKPAQNAQLLVRTLQVPNPNCGAHGPGEQQKNLDHIAETPPPLQNGIYSVSIFPVSSLGMSFNLNFLQSPTRVQTWSVASQNGTGFHLQFLGEVSRRVSDGCGRLECRQ